MHAEAMQWIEQTVAEWGITPPARILDVGGRQVNGTPEHLFAGCEYVSADILEGPDVGVVWDARTPTPFPGEFDVVLSTETLEHVEGWEAVVANMAASAVAGGRILITAAAPNRAPHSGIDGWELRPDEWYGNVEPAELRAVMAHFLDDVEVVHDRTHGDVYAKGVRR